MVSAIARKYRSMIDQSLIEINHFFSQINAKTIKIFWSFADWLTTSVDFLNKYFSNLQIVVKTNSFMDFCQKLGLFFYRLLIKWSIIKRLLVRNQLVVTIADKNRLF